MASKRDQGRHEVLTYKPTSRRLMVLPLKKEDEETGKGEEEQRRRGGEERGRGRVEESGRGREKGVKERVKEKKSRGGVEEWGEEEGGR
ncbi:hypothetical protein NHX12_008835 [Muraenolepis orangiensis]|uniref:Uncharacterized protein n=1 Tax=Muraenolepis orangiensis TaxID=630683 RepID=A0A9Q0DMA3_9TELE|nr:hypothetical protein NHX12_008835 [Muraenolepis orangiensis]